MRGGRDWEASASPAAPGDKTASAAAASGNVTWCIGKDTSGAFKQSVEALQQAEPEGEGEAARAPDVRRPQREQQIQRLRAKSTECDVLGMDVIWTAEYAAQGWLYDLTRRGRSARKRVHPLDGGNAPNTKARTGRCRSTPTPASSTTGQDEVPKAPTTWEQVYTEAKADGGLVYQGERYEGLTVDFLELLYSAGGKRPLRRRQDGRNRLAADAQKVLDFMRKGIKDGAVPKAVTDLQEEELAARLRGRQGDLHAQLALRLRARQRIGHRQRIRRRASSRASAGDKAAGVLGGYNLGISAYSNNPDGSLDLRRIRHGTEPAQKEMFIKATLPAVLTQTTRTPRSRRKCRSPKNC